MFPWLAVTVRMFDGVCFSVLTCGIWMLPIEWKRALTAPIPRSPLPDPCAPDSNHKILDIGREIGGASSVLYIDPFLDRGLEF
jgi:hypothetical protein